MPCDTCGQSFDVLLAVLTRATQDLAKLTGSILLDPCDWTGDPLN